MTLSHTCSSHHETHSLIAAHITNFWPFILGAYREAGVFNENCIMIRTVKNPVTVQTTRSAKHAAISIVHGSSYRKISQELQQNCLKLSNMNARSQ